jgi:hypothetical protein
METPQVPADGDYYLTLKCVSDRACEYWLRVRVEKTPPAPVTVDFP